MHRHSFFDYFYFQYYKFTIISGISSILAEAKKTKTLNLKRAFELGNLALQESIGRKDKASEAKTRLFLIGCYLEVSNYEKIMEHAIEALVYYESINDYANMALCYHYFGWVYYFLDDNKNRLSSNLECLKYRRKSGDTAGEISTLSNVGDTYLQMKNFDKALYYFNLCLEMPGLTPDNKTIVIHNIGETLFFSGDYQEALKYFRQSLALSQETGYIKIEISANVFLAKTHLNLKKIDAVLDYTHAALKIAEEHSFQENLYEIYLLLSQYLEIKGCTEQALDYLKKHISLKEKILKENNIKRIHRLQLGFEVDKLKSETKQHKEKNKELRNALWEIERQNIRIEQINSELTDSIRYAKRIQNAVIQPPEDINNILKEFHYFYQPKDIVSGDFYWSYFNGESYYFALADCTGHGVPGAFMSVLGVSSLNEIMSMTSSLNPAEILNRLQIKILNYITKTGGQRDGMDIFLLKYTIASKELEYSGANNSMYLISKTEKNISFKNKIVLGKTTLYDLRGDKQPIGFFEYFKPFKNNKIKILNDDIVYLFTDGFADQFGGNNDKKYMVARLKKEILKNSHLPIKKQKEILIRNFYDWKDENEQTDDVTFVILQF